MRCLYQNCLISTCPSLYNAGCYRCFGCLTLSLPSIHTSLNCILELKDSDLAAVGSRRMLFPNCGGMPGSQDMQSSRGPPSVTDLGLGLQSLRLSGWDRPWTSQETDSHTSPSQVQTSSPSSTYQLLVYVVWESNHIASLCYSCMLALG